MYPRICELFHKLFRLRHFLQFFTTLVYHFIKGDIPSDTFSLRE